TLYDTEFNVTNTHSLHDALPIGILTALGAEVRFFNPSGLPLVDDGVDASHPKVRELRDLVAWCEGMVWSSPERHGAMTGLMKTQDRKSTRLHSSHVKSTYAVFCL